MLQYFILLFTVLLLVASCYLSYVLAADGGQYSLYLSNVASNNTSMVEGSCLFDKPIWRTVLKTFFFGIVFSLIQASDFSLAAHWRQQLCGCFHKFLLRSPNGLAMMRTRTQVRSSGSSLDSGSNAL